MSYDIDLKDKDGNVVADFNIKYSSSGMFCCVFPEDGIRTIYGEPSEKALEHLLEIHYMLITCREQMKQYEPENGWGTWENTVKVINKMCMVAAENPDCVWSGD